MGSIASLIVNKDIAEETNATNRWIATETNKANENLAKQQNQWNIEARADERAYNDPAKQVERLKGAGLSDAAAAQAIEGAGNTGAIQSADLANQQIGNPMQPYQMDFSQMIPSVLGAMRQVMEMEKAGLEIKKEQSEANVWDKMLLSDIDLKQSQTDLKRQEFQHLFESWPYSLQAIKYGAESSKLLPNLKEAELKKLQSDREMVEMNVKRARQDFDWLDKIHGKEFEKMCEEIKNVIKGRDVMESQIGLNTAKKEEVEAGTENVKAQKEGIQADSAVKQLEAILKRYGSPDSSAERAAVLLAEGKISPERIDKIFSSLQDYVRQGNQWLGADPFTRDFLYYYWDEGKRRAATSGLGTQGFLQEIMDYYKKRPHQ